MVPVHHPSAFSSAVAARPRVGLTSRWSGDQNPIRRPLAAMTRPAARDQRHDVSHAAHRLHQERDRQRHQASRRGLVVGTDDDRDQWPREKERGKDADHRDRHQRREQSLDPSRDHAWLSGDVQRAQHGDERSVSSAATSRRSRPGSARATSTPPAKLAENALNLSRHCPLTRREQLRREERDSERSTYQRAQIGESRARQRR